uniref:Uncharacterized protein n=1 Tax=Tanacetum cinerariifolium TaxID=118510 RepID=A0A6L2KUI5_TANCI|nr:hypothetical protein [Tanacetum cinerariifolium]
MDYANLTMEEYIEFEAEKARRHGQMINWETATYGKVWHHNPPETIGIYGSDTTVRSTPMLLFTITRIGWVGYLADRLAFDGDFLGAVLSYTSIWDPLRRLCHRLIAFCIFRRGQAPKKVTATDLFYLRARMSGGQFISRLAEHFGLLTKERLRGLIVADLAPAQAPPATHIPRTKPQRMVRLEEEVYGLRDSFGEQCKVLSKMSRDFVMFTTLTTGRLSQLLDASGVTYTKFQVALNCLEDNYQYGNPPREGPKPFVARPSIKLGQRSETKPPSGFSTPPHIPNINTNERPLVTTTVFAATTPRHTSFAYHASTSTDPTPMISPDFVEANYEILESMLRDRRRQICNEDLQTELEYFSEDYDEELKMEPRPE